MEVLGIIVVIQIFIISGLKKRMKALEKSVDQIVDHINEEN
jgi:hypothetical protein